MNTEVLFFIGIFVFVGCGFGILIGSTQQGNSGKPSLLLAISLTGLGLLFGIPGLLFTIKGNWEALCLLFIAILCIIGGPVRYYASPPDIAKLESKRNVRGLIKALNYQKDKKVRTAAAEALGKLKDAHAVEPLITALKDSNADVREAVIGALGELKDTRAVEPLIAALKDGYWNVCQAAAEALGRHSWQPGKDENGANYWIKKMEWDKCVEIGAPAVEPLIAVLMDNNWYRCKMAAETLAKIGDARAIKPLETAFKRAKEQEDAEYAQDSDSEWGWHMDNFGIVQGGGGKPSDAYFFRSALEEALKNLQTKTQAPHR